MKKGFLFFFCLAQCCVSQAQYRFISFGVMDGLSQNSVNCIYQDAGGLLWLGTQDGLNSFDGRNFKTYKYDQKDTTTISDQFVLSITQDKSGFLWIATRNGFNRMDKRTGKFERFYDASQNEASVGRAYGYMQRSPQGDILADCGNIPLVLKLQGNHLTRLPLDSAVHHPVFDRSGDVWGVDSRNRLVQALRAGSFRSTNLYQGHPGFTKGAEYKTLSVGTRALWCYPTNGKGEIFVFDIEKKQWSEKYLPVPDVINDVQLDGNGTAWVSTLNGIYLVKDGAIIRHLSGKAHDQAGLPPGSILSSYTDSQGNIWLGSANAGFAYYHPDFDHFSIWQTGIQNDVVIAMASFGTGEKWIGANSGLYKMETSGGKTPAKTRHLFSGRKITALTKDQNNNLWAAVEKEGLFVVDRSGVIKQRITRHDSLLQTKNILHLFCDSDNRVWVCTEKGFFIHDPLTGKWRSFYQDYKHTISTGWYVLNAFEDNTKRIWICKQYGIDVYSQSLKLLFSISSEKNASPIGRTIITGVSQDNEGTIWIATLSNGVYAYRNTSIAQHFTTSDGLNSNVIYGITCDSKGRIWTTTTSGINVLDPVQKRFYSLHPSDGLPPSDYSLGALQLDEGGNILIGSSAGMIIANASAIALKKKTAVARISDVTVDGQSIEGVKSSFVLPVGYKTINFSFSIKQALQPRKVIYQFRMKGSESGWSILPAGATSISYSRLPFTTLVMQVRAAYVPEDLDSAPVDEFVIEVQPAFWQTKWFLFLIILLGVVLIALLAGWYNRAKYKKQLQEIQLQKKLQQERERIGRDLHDNIGAYTSALIAGINRIGKREGQDEKEIGELSEYAANIMVYLRETIWVLNHETVSLTAFCDRFIEYGNRIIRYYPAIMLHFREQVTTERSLTPQVSLHLFRILQEALQNACKHAEATRIEINFTSDTAILFSVQDNGKGLNDTMKQEGYGLESMRLRAGEIGFQVEIGSVKDTGTTIELSEK